MGQKGSKTAVLGHFGPFEPFGHPGQEGASILEADHSNMAPQLISGPSGQKGSKGVQKGVQNDPFLTPFEPFWPEGPDMS